MAPPPVARLGPGDPADIPQVAAERESVFSRIVASETEAPILT
jgi:hypothetical protein